MEKIVLCHRVKTPVRYQEHFPDQDLEAYKLNHSLFALPSPAGPAQIRNIHASKSAAETEQKSIDEATPKFQVLLDVVQFRPEDVIIQVFEGWLLIKAQHGPRMDEQGFIARSFTRQYKLPDGIEMKDLTALFCHDGILVIETKTFGSK
ncbi:heat shock protein beta-3 [Pseudonaja textilis]|uniref:Heat shock protein family B (small) member 3 n=2 Tax=Hydrophiinae TaxID=292440 RepID=A0A670YN78_PSETE|nr:heat shock protein beta-3 [Notechis scutatus]XP_026572360.1 heat shock protein beta-3 [Pseudonaja textilis]